MDTTMSARISVVLRRLQAATCAGMKIVIAGLSATVLTVGTAAADPPEILVVSTASLADGLSIVSVTTSVELGDRGWRSETLHDPERAIIRFSGFFGYPESGNQTVEDGVIRRIRCGFHPEFDPPEIHVVLDLENDSTRVAELRNAGRTLLIRVVRNDPTPRVPHPTPSPPPLEDPVTIPTPTPPHLATPTPDSGRPMPTTDPTQPRNSEVPHPSPTKATEMPGQQGAVDPLPRIEEIVATARGDGSTTVRVTTDIPLARKQFGCYRVADPPPRQVLSLIGVEDGEIPIRMSRTTPGLISIDASPRAIHRGVRVDLMLLLAGQGTEVTRVVQQGSHLVVVVTASSQTPDEGSAEHAQSVGER